MIDLSRLKASQSQLFLAEVAGVLHNLGKLAGQFVAKCADPENVKYEFERVVRPGDVLTIRTGRDHIQSKLWLDLLKTLCAEPIWGSATPAAVQIAANLSGAPVSLRGTRDRLNRAYTTALSANPTLAADLHNTRNRLGAAAALAALLQVPLPSTFDLLDSIDKNDQQYRFLCNTRLHVLNVDVSVGELLLLMWDVFHGWPDDQQRDETLAFWTDRSSILQRYLITAHGVISTTEKLGSQARQQSDATRTFGASAFGFEPDQRHLRPDDLELYRDRWLKAVIRDTQRSLAATTDHERNVARTSLLQASDEALAHGLGETKRPLNDIAVWDYVSPIAGLFKAAVAKAILEGHFVQPSDLRWQLLSVRYDGLAYLARTQHISDLLARAEALTTGLEAVRALIEVEYPLGNEIYRDENGSVYVAPYVEEDDRPVDLLALPVEGGESLGALIAQRFSAALPPARPAEGDRARPPLDGEVLPVIALNRQLPEEQGPGLPGKAIRLQHAAGWADPPLQADPAAVERWWADAVRHGEVCTVCGLRPQGYGASDADWQRHIRQNHRPGQEPIRCEVCKAQDRAVCHVCLERRDDRSMRWVTDSAAFEGTIWTDEVADENGRLALVVGRFGLEGWLDGQLIATMQKNDSFGRIRRCWRTTQEFWQEVARDLAEWVGGRWRERLIIKPENSPDLHGPLGPYHAYELELDGRYLSVVWDPAGEGRLITAENLAYARKILAVGDLVEYLQGRSLTLVEPSAHLTRRERKAAARVGAVESLAEAYSPAIALLAEPAIFLAMAPANKTLAVARKIRQKYEQEMGKVRDRLPLHLGLVFAPRRTPIRALLEAGCNMLKMPDRWRTWQIADVTPAGDPDSLPANGIKAVKFANRVCWQIPCAMGDFKIEGKDATGTLDVWHTHFLTAEPQNDAALATRPLRELSSGDQVCVRTSLFDFEYLDTTGRRFEISYNEAGRRRGAAHRPFLLEDLERFERLWEALVKSTPPLSTSQLRNLEGMLLGRMTEWQVGAAEPIDNDETYKSFARDVLHRLDKSWWRALSETQRAELEAAVGGGEILDLLDLRMHILKEPKEPQQPSAEGEEGATP